MTRTPVDETPQSPGTVIRVARKALRMSQTELASRIDDDQSNISKWENDSRPIPAHKARAIAEVLEVDERLLRDSEREPAPVTGRRIVHNTERLKEWNDSVSLDGDLSFNARGVLRVISALTDRVNWVAVLVPDDIISRGNVPPDVVDEAWEEVTESAYVERLGNVDYVFRLILPE